MKTFIMLCFICCVCYMQAQLPGEGYYIQDAYNANRIKQEFLQQMIKDVPIDIDDIEGSPYLNEAFLSGSIKDELTGEEKNVYLRYSIYSDIFELKYNPALDQTYAVLKNSTFTVKLGDMKFKYLSFRDENNKINTGYLESLARIQGRNVYKRYYQRLKMPKKAKTSFEQDYPPKLLTSHEYYIENDEGLLEVISTKKNDVAQLFKNPTEVKLFIKSQHIDLDHEEDFLKLLKHFKS